MGINRNIVECKFNWTGSQSHCIKVLIETLWNVNFYDLKVSCLSASINRNIVECKCSWSDTLYQSDLRINRNIVECKSQNGLIVLLVSNSINRNIVECKFRCHITSLNPLSVLIETLWNVNLQTAAVPAALQSLVLIETLWNVNSIPATTNASPFLY